jgi:hypothetical protein
VNCKGDVFEMSDSWNYGDWFVYGGISAVMAEYVLISVCAVRGVI